jgi:hypothetical protein
MRPPESMSGALRLRLRRTPHVVPHLKADYVELNGAATRQGSYRHERVLTRKEHVTTLARSPALGLLQDLVTPSYGRRPSRSLPWIRRRTTSSGIENSTRVSSAYVAGFDIRQIHRSLDARERPTGEARVQASKGSTGAVQAAGAYTERRPGAARKNGRSGRSPGAGCNWRKCRGG